MRFKAWFAMLIALFAIYGCAETPREEQVASQLWYSDTADIPVHVIFLQNGTTASGEPSTTDSSTGTVTTPRTVDQDIDAMNQTLLNAATDAGTARRVRFWRVSTTVVNMPTVTINKDADAGVGTKLEQFAQYFRPGMINIVVCNHNSGTSAGYADMQSNRAHVRYGGGFQHELGHLLELRHIFESADGSEGSQYREPLERQRDASVSTSCFRTGDRVCDTPPDYGWVEENAVGGGVFSSVCATGVVPPGCSPILCGTGGYPACAQTTNVPCTASETVPRISTVVGPAQTNYCQDLGGGNYQRIYDPALFGYVQYPSSPSSTQYRNLMGYTYQSFLTPEQFMRAWAYSRWTLNEPYAVPESDKDTMWDFMGISGRFGNGQTPWRARHRVSRIEVPLTLSSSGSLAAWSSYSFSPSALTRAGRGDGRALLGVELVATKTSGTLPSNSTAQIQTPRSGVVQSLRLEENGSLIRSQYTSTFSIGADGRGSLGSALGNWSASVWTGSGSSVSYTNLRLNLYLADRGNVTNSFFNRGISDVLVYRPSSRQLWVSFGDTSPGVFGYGQSASLPWSSTADCDAFLVAGNFDSDNTLDVICNAAYSSYIQPSGLFTGWKSLQSDGTVTGIGSITRSQSNTMIAGDFDSDFLDDLLLGPGTNISSGGWAVYRNEGNRAFAGPVTVTFDGYSAPRRPNATTFSSDTTWTVGDFDGDGLADLMVREASGSYGVMYFYRSLGLTSASSYGFAAPQQITVGGGSTAFYFTDDDMTAFDVTGDGADDLVFRRKSTGEWYVSNSPGPGFSTAAFGGGWTALIGGQYSGNYYSTDRVIGSSR